MTDYSTPEPLLKLPLKKFEHFRVSTHDAPPTSLLQQQQQDNDDNACRVCLKNISRYTCPRCELPYCSVKCYQDHCTQNNNNNGGDSSQPQPQNNSCTEAFYHDRVANALQLEQKAKTHDTHALIHRVYNQQNQIASQEVGNNDDDDMTEDLAQLLEMLNLLETHQNDDQQQVQEQQQQLASILAKSPKLKAAFEASLESGEVQQLVLKPWNPWWRPILARNTDSDSESHSNPVLDEHTREEEPEEEYVTRTLDERLLNVPSLEKLQGGKPLKTMPQLTYNLLEVLYRIACILRLYHGMPNAIADGETAVDAATTFLQSSTVLQQDARYESLEEVMLAIVTNNNNNNNGNSSTLLHGDQLNSISSWTTIARDVAYLVANPRLVGRALLEALDILKAAITYCKQHPHQQKQQELSDWRRKRKKLEFFLSWSQHSDANIPASLPEDIRAWVEHWKAPEAIDTDDNAFESLLLPSSSARYNNNAAASKKGSSNSDKLPLMQEVQRTPRANPKIEIL